MSPAAGFASPAPGDLGAPFICGITSEMGHKAHTGVRGGLPKGLDWILWYQVICQDMWDLTMAAASESCSCHRVCASRGYRTPKRAVR